MNKLDFGERIRFFGACFLLRGSRGFPNTGSDYEERGFTLGSWRVPVACPC